MLTDFRFVLRSLARHRTFALVTTLTLALGIGAAGAIFSVTDFVLFRLRSFPEGVYLIGGQSETQGLMPIRFDYMTQAYERTEAMSEYAKAASFSGNVVLDQEPIATSWMGVTPNLFPMLGVAPALGRGFLPEDTKGDGVSAVIVSDTFWRRHLGASRAALGRKIKVGDTMGTIIGVLRRDQVLPPYFYADLYRPLAYKSDPRTPWEPALWTLGRIRSGLSRQQARDILRGAKVETPPELANYVIKDQVVLSTLSEVNQNFMRTEVYWMMLGAVGMLYAIASLNASNLVLVRMLGQRRELAIRLALGGGRGRIIRLLVLESATLALAGSLLGALLANWLFPVLLYATGGQGAITWIGWSLGWRVLVVMGALSVVTSLIIVALPALRVMRTDLSSGLKDGGPVMGESRGLGRLRGGLVVLQVAFAIVLLCGAGLMIRTFQNFRRIDLGFDPADKAKVQLQLPPVAPDQNQARLEKLREIQAVLLRVPGVKAAGFGGDVLLPGYAFAESEVIGPGDKRVKASVRAWGKGFEQAAGLRLLRGQWLTHQQGDHVIINETLARTFWPGQDPIGQFLHSANVDPKTLKGWKGWYVEGVVADVRATLRDPALNCVYGPEPWAPGSFGTFVVRLSRPYDEAFVGLIRRQLYAYDPQLVVTQVQPLSGLRDNLLWAERMTDSVLKVLAVMAALLTTVGIFSVLAFAVNCRMTEFGIRLALGATRGNLVNLVLGRALLLAVGGLLIGVAAALALVRFLRSVLYHTSEQDPWMLAGVTLLLLLTALIGAALPAVRAARANTAQLLRRE